MKKTRIILVTSGILVIIGIWLSVYQAQLITSNLNILQQNIPVGQTMTVTKQLDSSVNQEGIYSVQVTDFKNDDNIKATILNPTGDSIVSKPITQSPYEEKFNISTTGVYKLQIENDGQNGVEVLGIIGSYPQNTWLLDIAGFVVLIVGLSGLAIGMMLFIKNRGRSRPS